MSLMRNRFNPLAVLGLLLAWMTVVSPPAEAKLNSPLITGIQVVEGKDKLKVHVSANGEVQYRVLNLTDPRIMTVIEVFPAQLLTSVPKLYPISQGTVERVRVGQFSDNPDVVRLVVDLKAPSRHQVMMAPGRKGMTVAVSSWEVASAKVPNADVVPAPSSVNPMPAPAVTSQAPVVKPVARKVPTLARITAAAPGLRVVAQNDMLAQAGRRPRQKMINLDFVNADLIYVLKLLAKEMNLNLVTDSSVKGAVTMSLKNVPAETALNLILKVSGFEYKLVGNIMIVGSKETLANIDESIEIPKVSEGPPIVLPIPLENAKASAVADTIKGIYPGVDVQVQADQNFIILKGSRSQLREIKEFVQKLDVPPPPPVVQKTELIPIKYGGVQTVLQLAKTLHPGVSYALEDRLNALIVTGQDKDIEALKAFLATIDIPVQQVMLDIKIVSLSEAGSKTLGLTLGTGGTFGTFGPITFTETFPNAAATTSQLAISGFVRSNFSVAAQLALLITQEEGRIISSPRVVTLSGKDSTVFIGDKFPIVFFDPRAGQFQVQYIDVGVKLVTKAVISADGFVTMDLKPEVSDFITLVQGQYPQTRITQVQTNVRVRDGDTFILGGLMRSVDTNNISKLPFLGDLPVLGELFRRTSVTKSKAEVFLMVTPKILQ